MGISKLTQFAVAALGLSYSVSACVKFNAERDGSNGDISATLYDNGGLTCWLNPENPGSIQLLELACNSPYVGFFDTGNGGVSYSYGSFSGSFGTSSSQSNDGSPFDPLNTYWSASVWGC